LGREAFWCQLATTADAGFTRWSALR